AWGSVVATCLTPPTLSEMPVNNGNLWHTPKMLTASGASSLLSEELTRIRGSTLREKLSTLPCRVGRSQGPRARPISYFLCHCLFVDRAERLGDVENRAKPVEVAHGPPTAGGDALLLPSSRHRAVVLAIGQVM